MQKMKEHHQKYASQAEEKEDVHNTRVDAFVQKESNLEMRRASFEEKNRTDTVTDPSLGKEVGALLHAGARVVGRVFSPSDEEVVEYALLWEDGRSACDYGLPPASFFTLVVHDRYGACCLSDLARDEAVARQWLSAFAKGHVPSFSAAEIAEELLSRGDVPFFEE